MLSNLKCILCNIRVGPLFELFHSGARLEFHELLTRR